MFPNDCELIQSYNHVPPLSRMKCKGTKNSAHTENSSPGYPGRREMNLNLFYWDAYATSSRLPRYSPKLPRLSVRESSDRDAAAAFEEEKRKAGRSQGVNAPLLKLTFRTWKDQHPKKKVVQTSNFRSELFVSGSVTKLYQQVFRWKRGHLHPLSTSFVEWWVTARGYCVEFS